jgi:hypothetical protein
MNALEGLLGSVRWTGRIEDADVLTARKAVYGDDGMIARPELDMLFTIDEAAKSASDQWVMFFAEAISDHLVHQMEPHGFIDQANADWLMKRIDQDGMVRSLSELEALIKCLEAATSAPESLSAYALKQVASAVIDGEGPLTGGRRLHKGRVDAEDVAMLRRILYAFGSSGNAAVTRAEAEVLFEINDRTAGLDNDPAWPDLFIKAIANFMMASSGYHTPTREVALMREHWLDQPTGGIMGFFARMFSGDIGWLFKEYGKPNRDGVEAAAAVINKRRDAEIAENEKITDSEAEWLAERIGRDGSVTANERALLTFIKGEAKDLHPKLKVLLNRAA